MKQKSILTNPNHYGEKGKNLVPIKGVLGYFLGFNGTVFSSSTSGKMKQKKTFERYLGTGVLYVALSDDNGISRNKRLSTITMESMSVVSIIKRNNREILDSNFNQVVKSLKQSQVLLPEVLEKYTIDELKAIHPTYSFSAEEETLGELF